MATAYQVYQAVIEEDALPTMSPVSPRHVALLLVIAAVGVMGVFLRPFALTPVQPAQPVAQEQAQPQQPPISVAPLPPGALWSGFTPSVLYWKDSILRWAGQTGLDPNLIATVMQIESCGDPQAVSGSGAQGLFQVMPFHFQTGENMKDPDVNAARGLNYLKQGLQQALGDAGLALAGYNGGHSVISKGWSSWAAETRRYYTWGSGIYQNATSNSADGSSLSAWLNAGGKSLCQQAAARLGVQ